MERCFIMFKQNVFNTVNSKTEVINDSILLNAAVISFFKASDTQSNGYIIIKARQNEHLLKWFPQIQAHPSYSPQKPITIKGNCYTEILKDEDFFASGLKFGEDKYGIHIEADNLMPKYVKDQLEESKGDINTLAKFIGALGVKGVRETRALQILKKFSDLTQLKSNEVSEYLTNLVKKDDKDDFIQSLSKVYPPNLKNLPDLWEKWKSQLDTQMVRMHLMSFNLREGEIKKIVEHFGQDAIQIIKENPYRLITIARVGFKRADRIAEQSGFAKTDPRRMFGGICAYFAEKTNMTGDTLLPVSDTFSELCEFMGYSEIEHKKLFRAEFIKHLKDGKAIKCIPLIENGVKNKHFTLNSDFSIEFDLMNKLNDIKKQGRVLTESELERCKVFLNPKEKLNNGAIIQLDPSQINAISTVLASPVSALTGGAGCGKTTILKRLVNCAKALKMTIALCAPTGKAAKRMTESINSGLTAQTIHSQFKLKGEQSQLHIASGESSALLSGRDNLNIDWLFIDESSMIDIYMASAILKHIRPNTRITFIGDPQQLPSVGKGCFFFDFIESGQFPIARLTKTHRQADGNDINDVAHAVLRNNPKELKLSQRQNVKYYGYDYLEQESVPQYDVNVNIAKDIIKQYVKLVRQHGIQNVQVLTPSRKAGHPLSSDSLNVSLRSELHNRQGDAFEEGDRVMGIKNNPVFRNGEVGTIVSKGEQTLYVLFDGDIEARECYEYEGFLQFGYAITVHKSQGSEYKHVLIPLSRSDVFMLNRNWLYTAITRGKEFVHLFGQKMPITMAVRKQSTRRNTMLRHLLNGAKPI